MDQNMTFEAALARLEEIVRALEEGSADLDGALSTFEEGVRLVRLCTERLDGAEQRVRMLMEGNGTVTAVPFEE